MRGLKYSTLLQIVDQLSRTPQGVRGLKLLLTMGILLIGGSHPARGAWIEIEIQLDDQLAVLVAPRKGCVD